MARVKSLRHHSNGYGAKHEKPKGYEYNHPAPAGLVRAGLVKVIDEAAVKTGGETAQKTGGETAQKTGGEARSK